LRAGEEPARALAVLGLRLSSRRAFGFGFRRRGSCGLASSACLASRILAKRFCLVGDPAWHFVAATACAVEFVLLRVGCCRSIKPAIHFSAKLRLARLHAVVASSPCVWRRSPDLRAVERDMPQLRQPGFFRQLQHCKNSLPSGGG